VILLGSQNVRCTHPPWNDQQLNHTKWDESNKIGDGLETYVYTSYQYLSKKKRPPLSVRQCSHPL